MSQSAELTWNGEAATRATRAGAVRGLYAGLEFVLGEAVKIVPLDEGTLQDSGKVAVDVGQLTGTITFDTPYAVVQHEDLTLNHANGRQAKYLERPMTEHQDQVMEMIAAAIRGEF